MLFYEMFAIGIAVVLLVAAIGGLAGRMMMGPEEMALLRLARPITHTDAPFCYPGPIVVVVAKLDI